jgi:hypothetical protein
MEVPMADVVPGSHDTETHAHARTEESTVEGFDSPLICKFDVASENQHMNAKLEW